MTILFYNDRRDLHKFMKFDVNIPETVFVIYEGIIDVSKSCIFQH